MNDIYIKLKAFVLILFIIIVFNNQNAVANNYKPFVQQQDSLLADSAVKDQMSVKNKRQKRHVNQWNKTAEKLNNVEGSSTIYAEDVNSIPVADITNTFVGRIVGLDASQSSGRTNPLFNFSSISLRGQTPLIVVDGVIRNYTNFNPDDIKSITVMKDALSTTMYGLRSSNGIVYITTKDRSEEKPFELNFTAQYGIAKQFKRPNFIVGADYAKLYNEAQQNTFPGITPAYSDATIAAYQNGTNDPFMQPNNDWFNSIYKDNFAQQRYNINAAGNGQSYRYYVALENFSQGGNFLTSADNAYNTTNYYKRYNIRTNAQIDFSSNIQLNLNLFGSIENSNEPGVGAAGILSRIYSTSPLAYPALNADGSYGGTSTIATNILASTVNSGYVNYNERTLSSDISLRFKLDDITKGLWSKGLLSINNYYLESISRTKSFAIYYPTTPGGSIYTKVGSDGTLIANSGVPGIGTQSKQTFYNILFGYDRIFGKNTLNILGTYNVDNIIGESNDDTFIAYTRLNQIYKNAGVTAKYNYGEKYLAELAMVYSSFNRYPPNARWGFLPSAGLGWVLSKENWFNNNTLNFLKVRGTIGQTAWANSNNYYTYLQNYSLSATGYNFGATTQAVNGSAESSLANSDITWEKAVKFDFGFEAEFLRNRLNLEVNYYNNKFYDELIQPIGGNASGIIGQTYPSINAGRDRFSGIETNISFADKTEDFTYYIKGNFSIAQNKVLDMQEGNHPYPWQYRAGQNAGSFGYEAIGFYQVGENVSQTANLSGYTPQPGDIKYKDLNNDGVISFLDSKKITTDKPVILLGLNFGFTYKNFDFNALIQGDLNRYANLNLGKMLAFNNSLGNVLDYTTENRWTPQNPVNATLPRLTLGTNTNNSQVSSFWLRKSNYLRLKNAEFGYTLPKRWTKRAKLNSVRFFVNGTNLLTWTNLDYLDPEVGLSQFPNYRLINSGVLIKM